MKTWVYVLIIGSLSLFALFYGLNPFFKGGPEKVTMEEVKQMVQRIEQRKAKKANRVRDLPKVIVPQVQEPQVPQCWQPFPPRWVVCQEAR